MKEAGEWRRGRGGQSRPKLGICTVYPRNRISVRGQQGSQCQIIKGLVEEILGLDGEMFVDLGMAVKGAPKHGFYFVTKHKA